MAGSFAKMKFKPLVEIKNYKIVKNKILVISIVLLFANSLFAQDEEKTALKLDTVDAVKTTSVKDQHRSGTCWSYAATSFIESELLRMNEGYFDLSEMYFVKHAYLNKALNYVKLHGKANFSAGGQAHDVMNVIRKHGMIPQKHYDGMIPGQEKPNHSELDDVLKGYVDGVLKTKERGVTKVWHDGLAAVLNTYLGSTPDNFEYDGNKETPESFTQKVNFNPENYVEITSFSHHPYYSKFRLEIPDNWNYADYYNVPPDVLMRIINESFAKGYSVCWDGDVSEKYFDHKKAALAVVPKDPGDDFETKDFTAETEEKNITEKTRREHFDTFSTTDDHLMHLTGVLKDQSGRKYYITKNSWGTDTNDNGGYLNMSENYIKLNTIAIMVHKDAIPENIRENLKL